LLLLAGCASGPSAPAAPTGNTHATLLITATNDAKIAVFKFNLQSLTLVSSTGAQVPILTAPQLVELGSISGVAHPLVAIDVPQGIYSSVKLTYGPSTFVVIDRSAGPDTTSIGNYNVNTTGGQPTTADLSLTAPLNVTGNTIGLLLNLNIPKSTTFTPFYDGSSTAFAPGGGQTTFTPVLSLSAITPAATPSTLQDGKVEDIHGQVTANAGGLLSIAADDGASFSFTTSSSTLFAGPNSTANPPIGSFVDIDAALQSDGSMLATNVQTEATTQIYNMVGQAVEYTQQTYLTNTGREQQGPGLPNGTGFYNNNILLTSSSQFAIAWPSGAAPGGLPFTPAFDQNSIMPGQNFATPLNALQTTGNVIPPANVVTLEPQTINATVVAVSTTNGQTSYEVNLAGDDLITIFGPGQQVVVHATAATHNIATSPLTSGSIVRFRGLLFNDGGTLRMVATTIEDGVPIS
jgi:hypothetical protein